MAKRDRDDEKPEKELDNLALSKQLIKQFNVDGKPKVAWCLATDDDNPTDVKEYISTGSTLLDYLIRNRKDGGIPVGKLTEIVGEEASGKSLLCAHLIAETQRRGGVAVYIDTENAANPEFMVQLGVNVKELVYLQPQTVEDVGEAIEKIIIKVRTGAPDRLVLIIWDGIAATPCKVELEGDFELSMDMQLAKSKVLSKMMKKLLEVWGRERIAMVFTNQLKVKIGVMHGDPMTTPGGKAVPYAASVRIRLNRSTEVKKEGKVGQELKAQNGTDTYGIHTYAKIIKNRLGPPLRRCEFNILFSKGIDDVDSWRDYLHGVGEVEKADGWCYISSYPSGKVEEKGASKGKDRGVKFREKGWAELLSADPKVKEHVLGLLEKHLVVRYGETPKDFEADAESLMDVEAAAELSQGG